MRTQMLHYLLYFMLLSISALAGPPGWQVNPADFEMSATVTAVLKLDQQIVTGSANRVGVFVGEFCRGVATPVNSMNTWLYFITVYSNTNNEKMNFQAYIAEHDSIFPITETMIFSANSASGNPLAPVELNAYRNYDFPPAVAGIPDQSITQGETFTTVPLSQYLQQTDDDSIVWTFTGNAFLTVSIHPNASATITPVFPNWTGSETIIFTATEQTTNQLSASDTATYSILAPDHPPELRTIPDQTIGWLGAFKSIDLEAYLEEQDGDAVDWSFSFLTEPGNAAPPAWSVNPADFEMSLTITARVTARNAAATSLNSILGAFAKMPGAGWECRGVATPQNVLGSALYFLTVYSNDNDEPIYFRFFDAPTGDVLSVKEWYAFQNNAAWGSPTVPIQLGAGYLHIQISTENVAQIGVIDSTWSGSEKVQFRATDSGTLHGYADSAIVHFTVLPDHQPRVENIPDQSVELGQNFNPFDLDDFLTERDNESVTWSFEGNLNLNVQVNGNHVVTVTPLNSAWVGTETIVFKATDNTANQLADSDSVEFNILPPDLPPQISNIPDQFAGIGGNFSAIELNSYLIKLDADSVSWTCFFPADPTAPAPAWSVQPTDYQLSQTMTAAIIALGDTMQAGNHLLAAFADGQCRGVASPIKVIDKWLYFLTIYSNNESEQISLKFYDATRQEIYPVEPSFVFQSNSVLGAPTSPHWLTAGFLKIAIDRQSLASIHIIDATWIGAEKVCFIATDLGRMPAKADSQIVSFTVLVSDHNPVVQGIPDQSILQGGQFNSILLNQFLTESDGDSVTWSAQGNVDLQVQITGSTAQISPPDATWSGSESIIFTATDVTATRLAGSDSVRFSVQRTVPVELVSLSAANEADGVRLKWTTATETNNFGFHLQRKSISENDWKEIAFHPGEGTTANPQSYSYFDRPVNPGKWFYRLQQQDVNGRVHYSPVIEILVAPPATFALLQNYPNPFNASTWIKYELPVGEHSVQLIIYDILGQRIKTLIDSKQQPAGYYQIIWDGTDDAGRPVSSGIYFYKLNTGKTGLVRRMAMVE